MKKRLTAWRFISRRKLSCQTEHGFALIEVLVGLAVLSIALIAGLRALYGVRTMPLLIYE